MSTVPTARAAALMKRCQIGVPKGLKAYDELHDILAECYGVIGSLTQERDALKRGESICTSCGLRQASDEPGNHNF